MDYRSASECQIIVQHSIEVTFGDWGSVSSKNFKLQTLTLLATFIPMFGENFDHLGQIYGLRPADRVCLFVRRVFEIEDSLPLGVQSTVITVDKCTIKIVSYY